MSPDCVEISESLYEFVGGEVGEEIRVRYEKHMTICPPCSQSLVEYRATVSFARALPKSKVLRAEFEVRLRALLAELKPE